MAICSLAGKENNMSVFTAADMLVPREDILKTWPVIACDQFTSQMEYWKKVEEEDWRKF